MGYNNMKVVDLKALTKERGLKGYSKLKKAELITFLQNNLRAPRTRPPRPTRPPPPPPTWEPRPSVRFRQNVMPGSRDVDIFEQQEMSKSRSPVKNKLKDWYDWLVSHVPKPIKDMASRAFKAFKGKIMRLYKKVKGEKEPGKEESFNPIKLEQAFNRAYRSYRINGKK